MDKKELITAVRAGLQDRSVTAVCRALESEHGKDHRPDYRTILRMKHGDGTPRNRSLYMLADYLGINHD